MGRTAWAVIVARVWWTRKINPRHIGLWKRRWVEKSKNRLFHPAWESRKERGIPTFPQPRRLLVKHKPDRSCATKTGHFNLLRTELLREGWLTLLLLRLQHRLLIISRVKLAEKLL